MAKHDLHSVPQPSDSFRPAEPAPDAAERLLANSPWWFISAALHAVLLLAAALVCIERLVPVDEGTLLIHVRAAAPLLVPPTIEGIRDVLVRKPLPTDDSQTPANDEPVLYFPEAAKSDHNETANDRDQHTMRGESPEFLSCLPGDMGGIRGRSRGPLAGLYETMGPGGGGGSAGAFGDRNGGGKQNLVNSRGGSHATERAVLEALKWLARHQSPDGGWKAEGFDAQCAGNRCSGHGYSDHDTGLTGLSLLAFLGAGYTNLSHDIIDDPVTGRPLRFGEVVKGAIRCLLKQQAADGRIGPKVPRYMYNHAIATLALTEAYGMTKSAVLEEPARKALEFLGQAKNSYKAWRYTERGGENDTSVTGWAIMALKSAEISELPHSRAAMEDARSFIQEVTETNYGKCGYMKMEDAGVQVTVQGKNDQYANHEAMTAVGMCTRIFVDRDIQDPMLDLGAKVLVGDLPAWDKAKKTNDYYYWYYGTLALFQFDGPDAQGGKSRGRYWEAWNERLTEALVGHQQRRADGCADGSWDAEDRWGFEGGRVYAVAINALSLEVYYRYANVFGSGKAKTVAK